MSSNQRTARGRVQILVMGALLAALPFAVVADGVFTPIGSMTAPRYYHTGSPAGCYYFTVTNNEASQTDGPFVILLR